MFDAYLQEIKDVGTLTPKTLEKCHETRDKWKKFKEEHTGMQDLQSLVLMMSALLVAYSFTYKKHTNSILNKSLQVDIRTVGS